MAKHLKDLPENLKKKCGSAEPVEPAFTTLGKTLPAVYLGSLTRIKCVDGNFIHGFLVARSVLQKVF